MSDIELVIRIPEEIRIALINNGRLLLGHRRSCDSYIKEAIINGTPLPKGHGRLIDADALWRKWVIDAIGKQEIDDVPTIIEADRESEE